MKEHFELQLPDLLYFVKASCHENLHETLSTLSESTIVIRNLHQNEPNFPQQLPNFLVKFIDTLKIHLDHEEKTLFPSIASGSAQTQANSIPHLVDDHDQIKGDLLALRRMTHNYQLPEGLENKLAYFYTTLKEMDRIILNHIQIENHILFPMLLDPHG